MRKYLAIATLVIVGVLTLKGSVAFASVSSVEVLQNGGFYGVKVSLSPSTWACVSSVNSLTIANTDSGTSNLFYVGGSVPQISSNISVISTVDLADGIYAIGLGLSGCGGSSVVDPFYFEVSNHNVTYHAVTQFISLTPENGTTTATSTTFGAQVYVSPDDYVSGMYLHVNFVNNTLQNGVGGSALDAWNSAFGGFDFPLDLGINTISTSTVFTNLGSTWGYYKVIKPNDTWVVGALLPDETLISTTTLFTIVQRTALDQAMASTSEQLITALVTGATTTPSILNCNPTSFDISSCLISVVVPSSALLQQDFNTIKNMPPWGYAFRFYDIMANTATGTMPKIEYTFGTTSIMYQLGLTTLDFDPFATLASTSNIVNTKSDQVSGKTVWEVLNPIIYIIVYLMLAFMVIKEITGVHIHDNDSHKKLKR